MFIEDVTFAADELKKLVGYKIVDTVITPDNDAYGFVVQKHGKPTERKVCWIDCDPEGNGPGWLSIEELLDSPPPTGESK